MQVAVLGTGTITNIDTVTGTGTGTGTRYCLLLLRNTDNKLKV